MPGNKGGILRGIVLTLIINMRLPGREVKHTLESGN